MTWNSCSFTYLFSSLFSLTCTREVLKKQIVCGRLFLRQQNSVANTADTKWMSNEALYGTALAWQDGFLARWMKPHVTSLSAQRNFYSACASLPFTAGESHCGPAATMAILLMHLSIGFSAACLIMHMMCSYISRWAVGHSSIRRF